MIMTGDGVVRELELRELALFVLVELPLRGAHHPRAVVCDAGLRRWTGADPDD